MQQPQMCDKHAAVVERMPISSFSRSEDLSCIVDRVQMLQTYACESLSRCRMPILTTAIGIKKGNWLLVPRLF